MELEDSDMSTRDENRIMSNDRSIESLKRELRDEKFGMNSIRLDTMDTKKELQQVAKSGKTYFWILMGVLVLACVAIGFAIYNYTEIQKDNEKFEIDDITINNDTISSIARLNIESRERMTLDSTTGMSIDASDGGILFGSGTCVGFFGTNPPVDQGVCQGITNGYVVGSGICVQADSEFTGGIGANSYTIGDIVFNLKRNGLIQL